MSFRFVVLATCLLGAGCSLLLAPAEPTQCSSQRDCDANPSFRGRVCDDGFCVVPGSGVAPVSNDAGEGCTSTASCTAANSGKISVCKTQGGACTPWQTPRCSLVSDPTLLAKPDVIVIGSILPFGVQQVNGGEVEVDYAERIHKAIDLGVKEVNAALPDGLPAPGSSPGSASRPFAVLYCDSEYDPDKAKEAMDQLVDVVGAQVVIVGSDDDLAAVSAKAAQDKVAVVCSDCVAPFPSGSNAWRIGPPVFSEAPMTAARVAALEADIRAAQTPPSSAPIKVAVLQTPDPGPEAFTAALEKVLKINGALATDASNADNFFVLTEEDPRTTAVNYESNVEALAAAKPDVLVVAMTAEFPTNYLQLLETKWDASKPKPYYVLTEMSYEVSSFDGKLSDASLRARVSGTHPAPDAALQANIDAFTLDYKNAYNFKSPDGNYSGYDAIYATAYAIAAASTSLSLDGPHISDGFSRLVGGPTTIDFRPDQLGLGIALLGTSTGTIDVRGLLSPLDWNLSTHDFDELDVGVFCFTLAPDGGLTINPDAGVRYDARTGAVTGTYSCP